MNITLQSQLTLLPLNIRKDQKHYIVEEPISGDFFEMPELCIDAIELINQGTTLGEIEKLLKEKYPDEEVDLLDFAQQLLDFGLIESIDGEKITKSKQSRSKEGLQWISPKMGRFLFHPIVRKGYLLLALANILLLILFPHVIPHYRDVFIFDSMLLNVFMYMAISLVIIIIHEFGHIAAIRSYNLPTSLHVGNRLFFLVFETDLTAAWKLPPKHRNVLYLAGMALEQTILFIALLIKIFGPEDHPLWTSIVGIVIFDIFIKSIYQCCFYMKTDIYYVFENMTGCYNLMESGKQYLHKWLPFLKKDDTTTAFQEEERVIRFYSVFYVFGILFTFSLFIFYFIPQFVYAYSHVISQLINPVSKGAYWDALIFLGVTILLVGILIIVIWKNRPQKEKHT